MSRRNWGRALEFNRLVSSLTYLQRTNKVVDNDSFLVLDLEEKDADAQPKQISLSGIQNSLNQSTVFTTAVSGIATAVVNTIGSGVTPYYGSFFDTTTQTNPSGNGYYNVMRYDSTDISKGVSIVSGSLIHVVNSGVYNIQFSAQLDKTDAGTDELEIWLAKNNENVPWSNTNITLDKNNTRYVAAWNWFLLLDNNEHAQIRWHSLDTDVRILASGSRVSPDRPATPSVILTVNRVA
jgi:hypothetical protein